MRRGGGRTVGKKWKCVPCSRNVNTNVLCGRLNIYGKVYITYNIQLTTETIIHADKYRQKLKLWHCGRTIILM
jgi:hypothetical protein